MRKLIVLFALITTTPTFAADKTQVTLEGELILVDCAVLHQYADQTLQFSHMAPCLARVKPDHGRFLLQLPNSPNIEVNFGMMIGKNYYRLNDVTSRSAEDLLRALKNAAPGHSVYISVTSPPPVVDPSGNRIRVISIQIQKKVSVQHKEAALLN